MPSLTPVCLSQRRIKGTDKVAKGFPVHTLNTPFLGTEKDPGVLL